jgi:hypothetical protein
MSFDVNWFSVDRAVMVQHEMEFPVSGVSQWLRNNSAKNDLAFWDQSRTRIPGGFLLPFSDLGP